MKKNKNDNTQMLTWIVIVLIITASFYFLFFRTSANQENLDQFAQCISDSGAKFYGAFWCSHCENQKKLFGKSKNLPYIECSTPDGQNQLNVCKEAGITGYPTWVFQNGETASGEQSFKKLAESTACELPQ